MRVFNNTFHDATQEIFMESLGGGLAHYFYIYNNVFYTSTTNKWTEPGIEIDWRKNGTIDNLRIVNNTFYNMGGSGGGWAIGKGDRHHINFTNSVIANNLFISNKANIELNETCTYTKTDLKVYANAFNNFFATMCGTHYGNISSFNRAMGARAGNANLACKPVATNVKTYDFHLQPSDTCAKNKGIDLATTYGWADMGSGWGKDKDGVTRATGAWNIGAYE